MSERPRLLIICPQFFGYHEAILSAAKGQGIDATWIEDRGGSSWPYKIGLKVLPTLTRNLTQQRALEKIEALDNPQGIDHVLIVKGDGLSLQTLQLLKSRASNAQISLYLWDNAKNIPSIERLAALCDRVLTFDPGDAQKTGWSFLPLFSRFTPSAPQPVENLQYDWSFIGSLHSDRHRVLRGLVASNPRLKYFVHCYSQNVMAGFLRSYRDPKAILPSAIPVTDQQLSSTEVQRISSQSKAVVDIEHPEQTGLTMRTIESLLQGQKLITTNTRLLDYDLYDPTRACVIDRAQPVIPESFLNEPFRAVPDEVANDYHIDSWLRKAIEISPKHETAKGL